MLHEIELNGYEAALVGERYLMFGTRGSYGIEQLHITAGEAWDGLDITATFCPPGEEPVRVLLGKDGCINVPPEATAKATHTVSGHIVFTGVSSGVRRISHDLTYRVADHSGTEDGEGGATPSIIDQILAETKADRVAAAESASAADKSAVDAAASAKAADDAANAALTAKRETEQAAADALQSIAEAETSAVQAVENTGREQSEAVAAAGDTQIGRINTASDTALKNIADTKAGALAEVTAEGGKQIGLIGDTAAGALDDIKSAKDGALTEISAEGQTQKSTVAAEGAAQLEAIARAATAELGRWAPRIEDTAGPAPVVQTDIAAARWPLYPTFHIDTVQAGEGDPSPENIRPISGRDAVKATLCGRNLLPLPHVQVSETKNGLNIAVNAYGTITVSGTATAETYLNLKPIPASLYRLMGLTGIVPAYDYPVTKNGFTFFDLTIQPDGKFARVYIVITKGSVVNRTYRPYIIKSAEPLLYEPYQGSVTQLPLPQTCYGGKVEWRHNSEFDKCIVLDGTEIWTEYTDENWQGAGYHVYRFYDADALYGQYIASNKYSSRMTASSFKGTLGVVSGGGAILFSVVEQKTVDDWKAYLAAQKKAGTPLIIYRQSTAYDGTNGLDVCLTEYQTGFVELDGTEGIEYQSAYNRFAYTLPSTDVNDSGFCSHYKKLLTGTPGEDKYIVIRPEAVYFYDSQYTDADAFNAYLAAQKAAGTPVQVAYQLAAPEVYALPAAPQFTALPDTNTLYCDTGDTEMMFAADTKKYIDSKIETLSTAIAALGTT